MLKPSIGKTGFYKWGTETLLISIYFSKNFFSIGWFNFLSLFSTSLSKSTQNSGVSFNDTLLYFRHWAALSVFTFPPRNCSTHYFMRVPNIFLGMGWNGLGWVGIGWDWLEWVGMGFNGLGWVGMDWYGLGLVGMGWKGVGMGCDGL